MLENVASDTTGPLDNRSHQLRLLLASLSCQTHDIETNLRSHRRVLEQAADEHCHIAVFPEMSLTGSVDAAASPQDLVSLESDHVKRLLSFTQNSGVPAVFGIAEIGPDERPYITQVYGAHNRIMGVQRKRHLGEGEGAFAAGKDHCLFTFGSLDFGITICSEGDVDHPIDVAAGSGAKVILFCAAPGLAGRRTGDSSSPSGHAWWEDRGLGAARRHAERLGVWVALVTQAGSTVDEDFPGLAALVAPGGEVVAHLADSHVGSLVVDLPVDFEVVPRREAARVIVVDELSRVLLVRFSNRSGDTWWCAPGGGLEPGETHVEAAQRELLEELGRDLQIGPEIGWRSHTLSFDGRPWMTQREQWFVARCRSFDVPAGKVAELRSEGVTDVRWWTEDELRSSLVPTAPRSLRHLVSVIASGSLPPADTDLGV